MRYLFTTLLIFNLITGQTQDTTTSLESKKHRTFDSLKSKLGTVNIEKRFNVLLSLFRGYLLENQDSAQKYIDMALIQAKRDKDSLGIVMAYNGIAHLLKGKGKLDETIELYTQALEISRRNKFKDQIKYMLNNLANAYSNCSVYDKALFFHFESLRLRKLEGNAIDISVTLHNIGSVYELLKDYKNALFFYNQSYDTKIRNNLKNEVELTLISAAQIHTKLNEFVEAEDKLNNAKSRCKKKECGTDVLVSISNAFGELLSSQEKYLEAQKFYEESLKLLDQNSSTIYSSLNVRQEYLAHTLYLLGFIHYNLNNYEAAISYLNTSLKIAEEFGIKETMMNNYKLISTIKNSKNEFKLAFVNLNKYVQLNSELLNGKVLGKIIELRTNFDQRENLSKIAAQERIVGLQNKFNVAVGTIAFLTLIISLILFRMNLQKQRVTKLLDLKVRERTKELEKNRDELMHAHDEKVVVLRAISSNLSSSLATLRGLSILATHDLPQHQVVYFKEAEATTQQMVNYVKRFIKD